MDKNIFNEAIPTEEQKINLKKRIFETNIETEENKMKKVFPFKAVAAIAAAFVLVVGAAVLVRVFANMNMSAMASNPSQSGNTSDIASNGGVDDPSNIEISVTDLKAKYPQYFDLDTTKGLEIHAWITVGEEDDFCVLVPKREKVYTSQEILDLPPVTVSQMKTILSSYNIEKEKITVKCFDHPTLALTEYDPEKFVQRICKELGLDEVSAELKDKYPQYFGLDTTKGLIVYVWIMESDPTKEDPHTELCTLLPGKNTSYTDSEIASQQGISISEMAQILSDYGVESTDISVRYFEHPSAKVIVDLLVDEYIAEKCRQLGVEKYTSDFNVMMNVNFVDDTKFTVSIQHITDYCTHLPGKLYTSPEYDVYLRYNDELISYGEYLQLTGAEIDIGELAWNTVLYYINDHEELLLEEDLSDTYGKLPVGEYFIRKEITLETESGTNISKYFYAPFTVKEKPVIPEDERDTVINIINGVDVRLGEGRYWNYSEYILEFDFAVVYDTPYNFYHDTFTENGGDIPFIPTTDGNTVYKTIKVGDKLSPDFTVTEASFNSNIIRDGNGKIAGVDAKMSENRLRAEGNATVTAYAYKQTDEFTGVSEVMVIIDPTKDMNGEIAHYRLFRERPYSFRYVSENGGLFEATSSTPVMKLSQVDIEKFDKNGLWKIELDITAIEMLYTERGGQSYISPEISGLRFIKEIEVSDPVAE